MERILGCDVSQYQGEINFQKMEDAGAKYVFIRKQVGYLGDVRFWENFERAKRTSLKVSIYGVPFVGYSIDRQFAKLIEGLSPSDLDFPPGDDVERKHSFTKSKAIGDVLNYHFRVSDWWGDALFYTAKFVWQDYYSSKPGWIDDWDLWVANYRDALQPKFIPHGWEERLDGTPVTVPESYAIWQYSADGNGRGNEFGAESRDIDLNLMHQWFWDKWIEPVDPAPPSDKALVSVAYNPEKTDIVLQEVT